MAHFAEIDQNNIVTRVIVAETQEWCETNLSGTCVQTSYNTSGNTHLLNGTPLRANYAGIGHTYDPVNDVFYAPQPFAYCNRIFQIFILLANPSGSLDGQKKNFQKKVFLSTDS